MRLNLQKRSIPIAIVAFLARAFGRSFGIYKDPQFGKGIEKRAKDYVVFLSKDEKSFLFRIALENLRRESDLLSEEVALVPEGLELHRRVVELANRYEVADRLATEMLTEPPLVKLFNGILAQALQDGANEVHINFNTTRDTFPVMLKVEGTWTEAMRIPACLEAPLRGVIARVEGIGFPVLAPRLSARVPLPQDLAFRWLDRQRLEIVINPSSSGSA